MTKILAGLFAALLFLPGAVAQEDKSEKERAKEEAKRKEDEAKTALKAYRETLSKAKSADDVIEALQKLEQAEPHSLIRQEFIARLETDRSIDVRIAAAGALGKFKKDNVACDVLLKNARAQKDENLQRKCIQRYGDIAPYGRSMDLRVFFTSENNAIAKEAIEAIKEIGSLRMLKPLIDLLGELENIREDKGESGGGGPPLPGVPQNESSNNQRLKRKQALTEPTRSAINAIYKKYDSKAKLNTYTEANAQYQRNKSQILDQQKKEDLEDKGIKPGEESGEKK
jgi:HEAT repeat protein